MEERIKKLEVVTKRLMRRSHKTVKAIITPYPISNCVVGEEVKGDILKYMFPCAGTITKGRLWLKEKVKSGAAITIGIDNELGGQSSAYKIHRRDFLVEPNIKVQSGDRLTVSIFPIVPEDTITECWIAFLWVPEVGETVIKQHLIDELENVSEE